MKIIINCLNVITVISITVLAIGEEANAYLDPGTGSIVIQSIIAAVVGVLYTIKVYWYKIKSIFTGKNNQHSEKKDNTPNKDPKNASQNDASC